MEKKKTTRTKSDLNEIIKHDNYATMNLYDAFGNIRDYCFIDIEDIEKISNHKWYLDNTGYISTTIDKKKIRLHRYLLNPPSSNVIVDHINNNKLDNRKSNLQLCNHIQNIQKSIRPTRTNKYRGVRKTKNNTYCASIEYNKNKRFKNYKTEEDALLQRLIWEIMYYKEFSPQMELIKEKYPYLLGYFKINHNMKFNDNIVKVNKIGNAIIKNEMFCPCMITKEDDTICPCLHCRENNECICGLYIME